MSIKIMWIVVVSCAFSWPGDSGAEDLGFRRVTEAELIAAMNQVNGFDPTATTNGARFQAEVIFVLANTVADSGRLDQAMVITPDDWYRAFLAKTNLVPETAPQYVKLAHENHQYMWLDARLDRVIDTVKEGERPVRAVNVIFWWPKEPKAHSEYSYQDTLSTPHLNVTNHRVIRYRLLDFGDRFFFDDIDGLTGRPTTGLLGFLFGLIGDGRVVVTGIAISKDGLQVVRGTAKKAFIGVTTTATISPDGRSEKDVPEGRLDLVALETLLQTPFEMAYKPLKWSVEMDRLIKDLNRNN
ncbi:MAG: hypothetical protein ACI8V2_001150 [Candidatus Latescibacterota bacterium]|jgi:hypothetical protein